MYTVRGETFEVVLLKDGEKLITRDLDNLDTVFYIKNKNIDPYD